MGFAPPPPAPREWFETTDEWVAYRRDELDRLYGPNGENIPIFGGMSERAATVLFVSIIAVFVGFVVALVWWFPW